MTREHPEILVVDDDDSVRSVTRRLLERLGFKAATAQNSCEALEQLALHKGNPFDAAIIDINLGSENGLTLGERITGEYRTPILYSTGDHTLELPGERILKPYTLNQLNAAVHKIIDA